eukprot:m.62095 g.62095  ORF g.62095 m.62095 type:complete len:642 (-) comp23083_c0_seq1:246-2171(-)
MVKIDMGTAVISLLWMVCVHGVAVTAVPTCSAEILDAVDVAETTAQRVCGVSDLSTLVRSNDYINKNNVDYFQGEPNFCNATCIDAVATIMRAWGKHDCDAGGEDYGHRRFVHGNLLSKQYECNPPREECINILTDFLFWKDTPDGQNCTMIYHDASTAALTGSNAATSKYASFCNGTCYSTINTKLTELYDAGCGTWPAYLIQQETFESFCSTDAQGTYCHEEYLAQTDVIVDAFNTSLTTTTRESHLANLCTMCFKKIQFLHMANFKVLRRFSREPELCIQDRESQEIGGASRYCLPLFDEKQQISDVSTANYQLATLAENMCKTDMGRCANRIWSHRLAQWTTTTTESSQLSSLIKYSCLEFISGGQSEYCNNVDNIKFLEGAHFTQSSANLNRPCTPSSITGECEHPTLCQSSWGSGSQCMPQCQISINEILLSIGCCFESWKDFVGNYTGIDASANFSRIEFLESSCCNQASTPQCNNRIKPTCAYYEYETTMSTTLPIPYEWVSKNLERFNTSVLVDIARNMGVLLESVTLSVVEGSVVDTRPTGTPDTWTRVVFIVGSTTSVVGAKMQRTWDHIDPFDWTNPIAAIFSDTEYIYRSRCLTEDIPLGVPCSGALSVTAQGMFVMAMATLALMLNH